MNEYMSQFEWGWIWPLTKSILLLAAGYLLARLAARTSEKLVSKHASGQQTMLIEKMVFFTVLLMFFISALQQLNFKLSVLLGSAGIITAAIGFASKSSIANIISGIFLIVEKSFVVGDTVKVNGVTGTVKSIDLLSVKIRTADNTLVRVPNERIISTDLTNLTHYRVRRIDITIGISYGQDIDKVKKVLLQLADNNERVLKKPAADVRITDFSDSTVNIRFSVYAHKEEFGSLKAELFEQIKADFDREKIDIPYPQLTVHQE